MPALPARVPSRVLLGLVAALTMLSTGRAGAQARPAAGALDARRDPRLARRLYLRSEGLTLRRVIERLSQRSGITLSVAGRAADESLVAFVPDASVAEIMGAIADLYRLEWTRGPGEKPGYRLVKIPRAVQEERLAREEGMKAVLAELMSQQPDKRGDTERDAFMAALRHLTPAQWDQVFRDGYLYLTLSRAPEPQRQAITDALKPVFSDLVGSARKTLRDLGPDGRPRAIGIEDPDVVPPADTGVFYVEYRLNEAAEIWAGLRAWGLTTYQPSMVRAQLNQTEGVRLYGERSQSPAKSAAPFAAPLPPAEPVGGRYEEWLDRLGALSDRTGVAIYADDYVAEAEARNRAQVPAGPGATLAQALTQFCSPGSFRGPRSFWWPRGNAALLRSSRWLWQQETVLPAALMDRLRAGLTSRERSITLEDLQALASLSLAQVHGHMAHQNFASMDAWKQGIQTPARLSAAAQQLLLARGNFMRIPTANRALNWEDLSPADQALLAALPDGPAAAGTPRYSARLEIMAGYTGKQRDQIFVEVATTWGSESSRAHFELPLRSTEPKGLLIASVERIHRPIRERKRLVCAIYYPWFGTPEHSGSYRHFEGLSREEKKVASFARYPEAGPYDSSDAEVVRRHLQQLKAAGVDALVCAWSGPGDPSEAAVRRLLPLAQAEGMKVCLRFQPEKPDTQPAAFIARITAALKPLVDSPAYLRVDGRPVFFAGWVWRYLDAQGWADTLAALDRTFAPGVFAIAPGMSGADAVLFDGLEPESPNPYRLVPPPPPGAPGNAAGNVAGAVNDFFNEHPQGRQQPKPKPGDPPPLSPAGEVLAAHSLSTGRLARSRGRLAVATVYPGFDFRVTGRNGMERVTVDRVDGRLYRESWEGGRRAGAEWILIESFNNWERGTEIEPSVELGDRYLKLTQELAGPFKAARPSTAAGAAR